MKLDTIFRAATVSVTIFAGILTLTCVARAVDKYTAPSASITTYNLDGSQSKVITPNSGQSVLVMAGCTTAISHGVAYVHLHRVSNTLLVWQGQDYLGNVVSGSSASPGALIAQVASDVALEVNNANSFRIRNTNMFVGFFRAGSVTMIW